MDEFKVNDFLTLKLERGRTNFYVNGELFNQCKFLMLNLPGKEMERFDDIESIDEVADILGWVDNGQKGVKYPFRASIQPGYHYKIDPETEFWGHCSNLQAWFEHSYDTRLLHTTLAFPLLRKLTEVGDSQAKKVFKKEIANRFKSGHPTVIKFFVEEQLLDYLSKEARKQFLEQDFSIILETIDKFHYDEKKYRAFSHLLEIIKETGLIKEHFLAFVKIIDKFHYDEKKYCAFSDLLDMAKKTGRIEEHFFAFLETIDKFRYNEKKYCVFSELIASIKSPELFDRYSSQIETQFLDLVIGIDKLFDKYKYHAFSELIASIKLIRPELVNKYSVIIEENTPSKEWLSEEELQAFPKNVENINQKIKNIILYIKQKVDITLNESLDHYREKFEDSPNFGRYCFHYGTSLLEHGNLVEAGEILNMVHGSEGWDSWWPDALFQKARLAAILGEKKYVIKFLERALRAEFALYRNEREKIFKTPKKFAGLKRSVIKEKVEKTTEFRSYISYITKTLTYDYDAEEERTKFWSYDWG